MPSPGASQTQDHEHSEQQRDPLTDARKFTVTPNVIYDYWLGYLKPPEYCVLAYLVRQTFGWHRTSDAISYKQFAEGKRDRDGKILDRGCGVTNPTAIKHALDRLVREGLVERTAVFHDDRGKATSRYRLIVHDPIEDQHEADAQPLTPYTPGVNGSTPGVNGSTPGVNGSTPGVVPHLRPAYDPIYAGRKTPSTPGVDTKERVKERAKERVKKESVCGADAPHRARERHQMVCTDDDPDASTERRLALKLAGDVLACKSTRVERLAAYERLCADLLAQGYACADLGRWMDWMNSGACYWQGKARMWSEGRMLDDLADWDSRGRPARKDEDDA